MGCLLRTFSIVAIILTIILGVIVSALGPSLIDQPYTVSEAAPTMLTSHTNPTIPHIIYYTYKTNIIETKEPRHFYDNIQNTTDMYFSAWNDPKSRVEFLDDDACRKVIVDADPKLLRHFNNETRGAYKADICRAAALYATGGYYFDIDIRAINPVLLGPNVTFSSVREKEIKNFFQAFLASTPGHPVMRETLRIVLAYYEGKHKLHGAMGPSTMGDGFQAASSNSSEMGAVRILRELQNVPNVKGYYADMPPQDGIGCCCQYIVHDPEARKAYFYSRIVGAGKNCLSRNNLNNTK